MNERQVKKLKKRLFCLIMISVIALSFAGCHGKKDKEEASQQKQEETLEDQESEDEIEDEFEEGEFGDFE